MRCAPTQSTRTFPTFPIGFLALVGAAVLLGSGSFLAVPLRAADPVAVVTITENNRTQTVDAGAGGTVTVVGNGNRITVTGECRVLTVQGNKNEVTLEAVAVVSTPGNKNRVSWSRALGGAQPQVSNLGSDNEIGTIVR